MNCPLENCFGLGGRAPAQAGVRASGMVLALGMVAAGLACTDGEASGTAAPVPTVAETPGLETPVASDDPAPQQPTASTRHATTPTPTEDARGEERAVAEAYLAYWDAILAANDPPDEFHPALRETATGEAFDSVFEAAQRNRLANRGLRLPEGSVYEHRPEVLEVDGDAATVRDCAVDDVLVVDLDTGDVVNDEVVTRLATVTLAREDGIWKVAHTRVEERWEGVAGCAVD